MVLRMIKKPTEEPQPSPGLMFNNMTHNPALLSNLQILVLMVVLIAACYPAIVYVEGKGPNSFILGTLPSAVAAYFVVPISFYAFNHKLRKYVWRETKEFLGLDPQTIEPIV